MKYKLGDTFKNDSEIVRICGVNEVKQTYKLRTLSPKKWQGTISYGISEEYIDNNYKLIYMEDN